MSYLRGTSGCFYVADGTRRATVDTMLELRRRTEKAIGPTPSILAINKGDLDKRWEVDEMLLARLAAEDLYVIQTSAKTGEHVESAFHQLATRILEAGQ
jgi:signal recognition particle receptor subunit beta